MVAEGALAEVLEKVWLANTAKPLPPSRKLPSKN
jgi:hypothetical protein